jgi:deoxyribonuclease V
LPGTAARAEALQRKLASQVTICPLPQHPELVAGATIRSVGGRSHACVAVLTFPELAPVARSAVPLAAAESYRSGFRAFREGTALLKALNRLGHTPDIVFFGGHGICHPRRCGLASHLGVLLDRPTVGCAESLLCGRAAAPGPRRGDWSPVLGAGGERLGAAVRTQAGRRPVYVSPGHRCDVETAVALALACTPRFRLPEPLRAARPTGRE